MEKHIRVAIDAPYCTLNSLTEKTERIWVVFHGYGMLARYFVRKFSVLDSEKNFIVAPQGLSKFYQEGFSGRVGATWMTKEDRLTEIKNQKTYVDHVLKEERVFDHPAKVTILGFSQGVATAVRYASKTEMNMEKLVLWAGTFPPEITRQDTAHWPVQLPIVYVTGLQDPFLKPGMIENQHETVMNATGINPDRIEFDGVHEMNEDIIKKL